MYVVTFYSFKGGVGRTLAMVNIGVELANTGRKVLLVDFDLEAPGIDTFQSLAPPAPCPGIVDYVTDYLHGQLDLDFQRFHYQAENIGNDHGRLWVMPAGQRGPAYASKLASIHWSELYGQREGFLLMEHLKSQWEETLKPDYVLIDSRTGHSEIGGICTRQLPHTVVVLFIPNEQNLEGVSATVGAIRAENADRNDRINVELVASNVPSLDDEYQILRKMMRKFETCLSVEDIRRSRTHISLINRYDSMHLLNQTIFVTERPHSRLSKQYRSLLRRIVDHNLEDREAALREISLHFPRPSHARRFSLRAKDFDSVMSGDVVGRIPDILAHHAEDAEINFMIGQHYKSRGDLDRAETFFLRATEIASSKDEKGIGRFELGLIETLVNQGKTEGASDKLLVVLQRELSEPELKHAVGLLVRVTDSPGEDWLTLSALKSLTPKEFGTIAWSCNSSRRWQEFLVSLFECSVETHGFHESSLDNDVVLAAIGTESYDLVLARINEAQVFQDNDIGECFNVAMAKWGKERRPDPSWFARVIQLDMTEPSSPTANYEQCLALAHAITRDSDHARQRLEKARQIVGEFDSSEFSCWSYLIVDEPMFRSDLDEIEQLVDGESVLPKFMR